MRQCPRTAIGGARGGERGGRDVIAGLEAAAILQLGAGCDPHHTGHVRQAQLARETPRAREPVDLARHRDATLLDAAMPLVEVGVGVERGGISLGEEGLDLGPQRRLVGLHRQKIVRAGGPDR